MLKLDLWPFQTHLYPMGQNKATIASNDAQQKENQPQRLEQITIWPHRSLSPKGFHILMGLLATILFIIGLGFFFAGAWPIIGFLGLELLVVWAAFKLNYRAAQHREIIQTTTSDVTVESQSPAGKRERKSFPIGWLRVKLLRFKTSNSKSFDKQKIILSSHGEHAEIGKYLHPAEKADLTRDIDEMIHRARTKRDIS